MTKNRNQNTQTSHSLLLDVMTRLEGAGYLLLSSISMAANTLSSGFYPFNQPLENYNSATKLADQGHHMLFKPCSRFNNEENVSVESNSAPTNKY